MLDGLTLGGGLRRVEVGRADAVGDEGKGVIMISSELPELLGVCDRIYTVFEGRITGEMSAAEATQESLMRLMTDTAAA